MIPYNNFKEKIDITRKYDRKANMKDIHNKYIYMEINNENINENFVSDGNGDDIPLLQGK